MNSRPKVLFLYLGRRGALGRFTLELAEALRQMPQLESIFAISKTNENIDDFAWLGDALIPVETFSGVASLFNVRHFLAARRHLIRIITDKNVKAVVTLMPHLWTPLLSRTIRARKVKYATIIHDSIGHPGDASGLLIPWLRSEARSADLVVTLSHSVADDLIRRGSADSVRTLTLSLPDLKYGSTGRQQAWSGATPLRVLFLGRIMKYKGLALLVEAIEQLNAEGLRIEFGVAGAGELGNLQQRLTALKAEVINRWLDDSEIAPLLARYDTVALPYTEASQSGVAAVAFGSCMPVIAMPSGGLTEQVIHGKTGLLATGVDVSAFADAIRLMATNPALYQTMSGYLRESSSNRSMNKFLIDILGDRRLAIL